MRQAHLKLASVSLDSYKQEELGSFYRESDFRHLCTAVQVELPYSDNKNVIKMTSDLMEHVQTSGYFGYHKNKKGGRTFKY
jgi:hypothetical protein